MNQVDNVLSAVKGLLKQNKIKYAQVAEHLGLSESSIKRSFSQGQISLNRLAKICELMDLSLLDLLQVIQSQSEEISELTQEQEQIMVKDVKYLLVTVCVCNHWTFEEIIDVYDFDAAELISMLLWLERNELLSLLPNNKIKLKISPHFHWIKNGPIQQFFEAHIQQEFWQSTFTGPGEIRLLVNGMLSKQSNETIQKHINRLKQQFSLLSEQDQHLSMDQRHGSTLVVGLRPWEMNLFNQLRRSENLKSFK